MRLANAFLQSGTIAILEGQKFPKQSFIADSSKFITSAPLIVLVNHGTAGAAELFAAAMLESKRGRLVGDRTFGEGSVQKTFELPNGAALILSIAKYESPSGKKIQDESVTPNVLVASNEDLPLPDDSEGPSIPGTPAKVTPAPAGKPGGPAATPKNPGSATPGATTPASTEPANAGPKTDDQLNKALELLKQTAASSK